MSDRLFLELIPQELLWDNLGPALKSLSHGHHFPPTCRDVADEMLTLGFGMMWVSTQHFWIRWMSYSLTCMLRYEI